MNIKDYVIDFIEGRVDPKEFIRKSFESDEIFDWIQSILPPDETCYKNTWQTDKWGDRHIKQEVVPYDIRLVVAQSMRYSGCVEDKVSIPMYSRQMMRTFHSCVSSLVIKSFPDEPIVCFTKYYDDYNFLLEACPSYIGGIEVEESELLDELMDSIPTNLSNAQRIKWFKQHVKDLFYIQGNKYPKWLNDPEWPMSGRNPMRFISQKHDKNYIYEYVFEDVDTGKIRVIKQFT